MGGNSSAFWLRTRRSDRRSRRSLHARSLKTCLDRLDAAHADGLDLLSRRDRDLAAHVAKPGAGTDDGVFAGLELDLAPGERTEGPDALDGDLRRIIRF